MCCGSLCAATISRIMLILKSTVIAWKHVCAANAFLERNFSIELNKKIHKNKNVREIIWTSVIDKKKYFFFWFLWWMFGMMTFFLQFYDDECEYIEVQSTKKGRRWFVLSFSLLIFLFVTSSTVPSTQSSNVDKWNMCSVS